MRAVKNVNAARCPYYMTTLTSEESSLLDYGNLPLRHDAGIKAKANEIEHAHSNKAREALQKDSGINGEVSREEMIRFRLTLTPR